MKPLSEEKLDNGALWWRFLEENGYPPAKICPVTNRAIFSVQPGSKSIMELVEIFRFLYQREDGDQ